MALQISYTDVNGWEHSQSYWKVIMWQNRNLDSPKCVVDLRWYHDSTYRNKERIEQDDYVIDRKRYTFDAYYKIDDELYTRIKQEEMFLNATDV